MTTDIMEIPVSPIPPATPPRRSPLHATHTALGASFTAFGGWDMPVRYASDLAEHRAVREAAGLFDISHMAEFWISGAGSAEFLDWVVTGKLSAVRVGRAKYTLLLNDGGGVLDDLIVYRTGEERYLVIANAGNHDTVAHALDTRRAAWIEQHGHAPTIEDVTDDTALLAVQGPRAARILSALPGIDLGTQTIDGIGNYAFAEGTYAGHPLLVARTGYTGEDGFELLVPRDLGATLWDALMQTGAAEGLVPAGLAARDTLRLEAGMPLHGHEISIDTRPVDAGLSWAVAADKDDFIGKTAAFADPSERRVLVGLVSNGRRAGRAGYTVVDADHATPVGTVTSGALSPTLGHPIALAAVDRDVSAPGTELAIDVRGTKIPATVTTLPFYRRTK